MARTTKKKQDLEELARWDGTADFHGHTVRFFPYIGLLAARRHLETPDVPTYTYEDVSGEEVERPMNDEVAAHPKTSAEDKKRYEAWKKEVDRIQSDNVVKMTRVLFLRCLEVEDVPEDLHAWAADFEDYFGVEVDQEDERELLLSFISNEVVRTTDDFALAIRYVLRASGADPEVLEELEASFRDNLGRPLEYHKDTQDAGRTTDGGK
jgi:hypothetical protein